VLNNTGRNLIKSLIIVVIMIIIIIQAGPSRCTHATILAIRNVWGFVPGLGP
jgi:hypothetical protein